MSTTNEPPALACYRCGGSLARLTLPLSRLDMCPGCGIELHACRMCVHYLPSTADACTEDDAEPVSDKTRANFCDYFRPNPDAFDGELRTADMRARDQLATLFGDTGAQSAEEQDNTGDATAAARARADALFGR